MPIEADASESAPDSVESPCVRRCTLDDADLCVGCGRTLEEILNWVAAPAERKIEIRALAAGRLDQLAMRRRNGGK